MSAGLLLSGAGAFLSITEVSDFPGDVAIKGLHAGQPVAQQDIERGIENRTLTVRYHDTGERRLDLSTLLIQSAAVPTMEADERREVWRDAQRHVTRSLTLRPTNPYAWTQLAVIELALSGPTPRADELFAMSVAVAPVEERLQTWRVNYGLANRAWLSEESRALVRTQIRHLARMDPDTLKALALRHDAVERVNTILEPHGLKITP